MFTPILIDKGIFLMFRTARWRNKKNIKSPL